MNITFNQILESLPKESIHEFREVLYRYPMGKDRRNLIKTYFDQNPDFQLLVDSRYTRQVKFDSDLKRLIKDRFLKQIRKYDAGNCSKTYLIKA
jgi:hypothetical protein